MKVNRSKLDFVQSLATITTMMWLLKLISKYSDEISYVTVLFVFIKISIKIVSFISKLNIFPPMKITVALEKEEVSEMLHDYPKFDPSRLINEKDVVYLWDPSTYGESSP